MQPPREISIPSQTNQASHNSKGPGCNCLHWTVSKAPCTVNPKVVQVSQASILSTEKFDACTSTICYRKVSHLKSLWLLYIVSQLTFLYSISGTLYQYLPIFSKNTLGKKLLIHTVILPIKCSKVVAVCATCSIVGDHIFQS